MSTVQNHYGPRDPNERSCRTCHYWGGERLWPIRDEDQEDRCNVLVAGKLPPYLAKALEVVGVEPLTRVADSCSFHEYRR